MCSPSSVGQPPIGQLRDSVDRLRFGEGTLDDSEIGRDIWVVEIATPGVY